MVVLHLAFFDYNYFNQILGGKKYIVANMKLKLIIPLPLKIMITVSFYHKEKAIKHSLI